MPIDKLKIDRSFIRDVAHDANSGAIVAAMVAMARTLGLKTVAEGVETAEQLGFLLGVECDLIQGYHFGRPVPAGQFDWSSRTSPNDSGA